MTAPRSARREPRPPPDAERSLEIAAAYLGARPRTRWEVARRLRRAGAADDVIDATADRLAEMGLLDDAAFARWWGEQRDRHGPRGQRMIEAELRQHGVPREVIEAYRAEHADPERRPEDEHLPGTEPERAADALARHLRGRPVPSEPKGLQRLGMYLVRRGFAPDTARAAIRELSTAGGDDLS